MSDRELRTALVGFGPAGAGLHAPQIAAVDGLELSAVVTRDAGRRAEVASAYPGAAVLDSPDEVWAGGYDLVVVAAPNRAHAVVARGAIEAGMAVVVDKPLAPTEAVARALVEQATGADVPLGVFQNRRWDEDFIALRQVVADGSVGEVARLDCAWDRWRPEVDADRWREAADPADAGGLLFDLGSHLIDQMLVLFGEPESVYAELERRRSGAQVDDDAFVALRFPGGPVAHLAMTMLGADPRPRYRLVGTGGTRSWQWSEEEPTAAASFYEGVRDAVRDGTPMPVTGEDGVAVLRVIEAARRSAEESAVVAL